MNAHLDLWDTSEGGRLSRTPAQRVGLLRSIAFLGLFENRLGLTPFVHLLRHVGFSGGMSDGGKAGRGPSSRRVPTMADPRHESLSEKQ